MSATSDQHYAVREGGSLCPTLPTRTGYVMINEYFTGGPGSPFGGYKQSGIGRERGLMALQNYTQVKNVVVRVGRNSSGP